jgi:hypothetical protein
MTFRKDSEKDNQKYFRQAICVSNLNIYFCTPFLTGVYNALIW